VIISKTQIKPSPVTMPKTLFGYDVFARIGEGAASIIYSVREPRTGQAYALKHVIRKTEKDIRYIEQVENEFEVSRNFRHPGLRKCVDLKLTKKFFGGVTEAGLVMELIEGKALDEHLPEDLHSVIDCFGKVARSLGGLHYLQYVHCDLKPGNIIIQPDQQVKLIDFGQACKIGTIKQRVQGTPDFIAPEQVRLKPVSIQTDVFNFGATFYWALTGKRVPTLYTVSKSARTILTEQRFPSPHEINPQVPQELSDLVMQCVEMRRSARPEGMGGVMEVLRKFVGE
jgi:eukaryotic-like serine/threonine-protein kinase